MKIVCMLLILSVGMPCLSQNVFTVKDRKHRKQSKLLMNVEKASMVINSRVIPLVKSIGEIQEFTSKAVSVVNGAVRNIKMVKRLILMQKEIGELVEGSINKITAPRDQDGDGEDDLDFLDRWRHVEILLAIAGQADDVFDLFKNVIEGDGTVMDDKGRLTLIKEAYGDALKIRNAIRVQLRRINREIFKHRMEKREIEAFAKIFKSSE